MTIKEEIMAMPVCQALGLRVRLNYPGEEVGRISTIDMCGIAVDGKHFGYIAKYEDIKEIVR